MMDDDDDFVSKKLIKLMVQLRRYKGGVNDSFLLLSIANMSLCWTRSKLFYEYFIKNKKVRLALVVKHKFIGLVGGINEVSFIQTVSFADQIRRSKLSWLG